MEEEKDANILPLSKEELGKLIKNAREMKSKKIGKKFTQKNLADALKKSRSYIGDIEAGRIYPNYRALSNIASICEVPFSFFDVSEEYQNIADNEAHEFNIYNHITFQIISLEKLCTSSTTRITAKCMQDNEIITINMLDGLLNYKEHIKAKLIAQYVGKTRKKESDLFNNIKPGDII